MIKHSILTLLNNINFINKKTLLILLSASYISLSIYSPLSHAKDRLPIEVKQHILASQYDLALPKLKQLADNGNSQAQYQLALCYLNGYAVDKSVTKAEHWLTLSAQKNNKASYLLGSFYAKGKTLPKNQTKAKKFLQQAITQGNRQAEKLFDFLYNQHDKTSPLLDKKVISAIKTGDLKRIKQLHSQTIDFNKQDKQGNNALMIAIANKQEKIALWLLTNITNTTNTTNKKLVQQSNFEKNTPLHLAIINNQQKVAYLLLENIDTPTLDAKNKKNQTPLILAVINKNQTLAQTLINKGANTKTKDIDNKDVKYYARIAKMPLVIQSIKVKKSKTAKLSTKELKQKQHTLALQAKDKNSPYYHWPLLAISVAQKQKELSQFLLKKGHNPWKTNPQNYGAIHIAVEQDNSPLALQLISAGKKASNSYDVSNIAQLFRTAIEHKNLVVIDKLLTLVDNNTFKKIPIDQTPLWFAIQYNHQDIFIKIARKIPPQQCSKQQENCLDDQGRSYLLYASELNSTEISLLLIASEVDVNVLNNKNRNALWYAADFGNHKLVKDLLFAKSDISPIDYHGHTPLMRAVLTNCIDCVESLLLAGADPQKKNKNENSAFIFAAQGKAEILKVILDHDKKQTESTLNIKQRNGHSYTALMLAIKSNSIECTKLLLNAGANPKRKNDNGENSFDLAKNKPEILAILNH